MEQIHGLYEFIGEIAMLVVGLAIFIVCAGIKVQCPACGERFYHHHRICPECGYEQGAILPEDEDGDNNQD